MLSPRHKNGRFGPWDDQFKLGKVLDKGSQGEVLICTRLKNAAEYAVKRIDVGTLEMRNKKGKVRVNLKREIEIMRELTHPRIVNLLEAFWREDVCFIVMDLARGGSLHDKLEVGVGLPGGEDASRYVVRQLLEGMGYMHEHEVVHRDLKPQNILITKSWGPDSPSRSKRNNSIYHDVKIADFGLSRCLKAVGGVSHKLTAVGTPAFAAPEVLQGNYDEAADYWSFGCITYTMLAGEYPFDECPDHIRHPERYKDGTAPRVADCSAWRSASADARAFVLGLLSVTVADRFGLNECLRHRWLMLNASGSPTSVCEDQAQKVPSHRAALEVASSAHGSIAFWCCGPLHWPPWRLQQPSLSSRRFSGRLVQPLRRGVVKKISGWSGSVVDSMDLAWHDVEKPRGWRMGGGGVKRNEWRLQKDEVIIAVRQETGNLLGNALVFYTSRCQIIALTGTDAVKRRRFVAPVGWQVIGLQFEEHRLSGILMERVPRSGEGSVELVSGNVGYAVDSVSFHMRDGGVFSYGGDGGSMPEEFPLDKDEYIVIVEQGPREGYIGNSLVFFLSSGRVIQYKGIAAAHSLRFMAKPGEQICDLDFKDVGGGRLQLCSISTCPLDGNTEVAQQHAVEDPAEHHAPMTANNGNDAGGSAH
eukprot:TRINITY_DN10033_c0_g1_i2.p1 TRINITY_DN10033_c0_g1~~TRINITY_DN10033_c0_g1_i2.p1  ORF type:complete len:644 (+),score=126.60 TRINITY_DN10033_c0_g1_i2:86-2017(+)